MRGSVVMKVITVTANPCIDRTVWVDEFNIGGTNRVSRVLESVNGKGINTSVVVRNLGYNTVAAVIDRLEGERAEAYLASVGIPAVAVTASGKLRVNTKIFDVYDQTVTELNCKGEPIDEGIQKEFLNAVCSAIEEGDVVVVSGSVPPNMTVDFYRELLVSAKNKGAYTILDADGELLIEGIKGKPELIKPNMDELSRLCGRNVRDIDEAIDEANMLRKMGVGAVCISFGGKGALYVTESGNYWADALKLEVKGTVGAGDSMVAGFAVAHLKGMSSAEALRSAIAAASGSVSLEGTQLCNAELYGKMLSLVKVEKL